MASTGCSWLLSRLVTLWGLSSEKEQKLILEAGLFANLLRVCIHQEESIDASCTGTFDPTQYIAQGNRYNCPDFRSQADAQAVLRADPSDANRLDRDKGGIACERNPAPHSRAPAPRF